MRGIVREMFKCENAGDVRGDTGHHMVWVAQRGKTASQWNCKRLHMFGKGYPFPHHPNIPLTACGSNNP